MIAKEMASGKSPKGLIKYVFNGKLEHHKGEQKQAHIMAASQELIRPYNFKDRDAIKQIENDFDSRIAQYLKDNPNNSSKLVGHALLSFTDSDLQKLGGDAKKVLDDYIKISGIDKTQHFAVGHLDTKNYHIHIVYNKVNDEGKVINEWKSKNKAVERGVAISLKHKLELCGNSKKLANVKGVLDIRKKDDDIVKLRNSTPLLKEARNMLHLEKLAEKNNVKVDYLNSKNQISLDGKALDKDDLNAVFYLNRNPDGRENENLKVTKNSNDGSENESKKIEFGSERGELNKSENISTDIFQGMFTGGSDTSSYIKEDDKIKKFLKLKNNKKYKPNYEIKSGNQMKNKSLER